MIKHKIFYSTPEIENNTFSFSKLRIVDPKEFVSAYENATKWLNKNLKDIKVIGITATLPNLNDENTEVCVFYYTKK